MKNLLLIFLVIIKYNFKLSAEEEVELLKISLTAIKNELKNFLKENPPNKI